MKYYIVRKCLTEGIIEIEGEIDRDSILGPRVISVDKDGLRHTWPISMCIRSKDEAYARARKMRDAKVESLTNQLARVRALNFYLPPNNTEMTTLRYGVVDLSALEVLGFREGSYYDGFDDFLELMCRHFDKPGFPPLLYLVMPGSEDTILQFNRDSDPLAQGRLRPLRREANA